MRKANKLMLAAVMAIVLPTGALAAEADLQAKIDKLSAQMEDLKGQVQKIEDKSLGKWLHIGGDYRFRVDYLTGQTAAYSSAIGTMQNMTTDFVAGGRPIINGVFGAGVINNPVTMSYLTQPIAGTVVGGVPNPNAMQFLFASQPGKLFSGTQFGMIMNSYMPSAMYNAFTAQGGIGAQLQQMMQEVGAATVASQMAAGRTQQQAMGMIPGAINQKLYALNSQTALTRQQTGILNTLKQYVMPSVMARTPAPGFGPGVTLGDQWNNMLTQLSNQGIDSNAFNQVAMQMAMQGFLGQPSQTNAVSYLQQVASSRPTNDSLYTNRFGLDLKAKATQDVTVNVRLLAYKVFGAQDSSAVTGNYFADRVGVFDGTLGHVPSSSYLDVDRAYATWSNILDQPIWFSVGRRPATDGAPTNLKNNTQPPGNGGTPALLVNYAFDGMTIGYAPDIEMLPGFYAKVCYGRGFESGLDTTNAIRNSVKDTDMLGVAVIPVDTDLLRVWTQWNRGFEIFDFPVMNGTAFGDTGPAVNLGAIDWFGIGASSTIKKLGPGDLNFFVDTAMSITHPTKNVSDNAGYQGLLSGEFFSQDFNPTAKTGYAVYAGVRYDFPTRTKIGFEYNYGSKYWITFSPAADDMWTSKVGTRGQVFEPYVIQELNLKPLSSYFAKAFFKVGYQYYNFDYTGSNNWVGAPIKMSDVQSTDLMLMAPLKRAQNVYGTFEVHF